MADEQEKMLAVGDTSKSDDVTIRPGALQHAPSPADPGPVYRDTVCTKPPSSTPTKAARAQGDGRGPTRGPGRSKYSEALKTLCPIRCAKSPPDTLPLDSNGFLNYMTFGWLTPYVWRIYRSGVAGITGTNMRHKDTAQVCREKMERLWQEELRTKGPEAASFGRVMFKAFKTRVLIGLIFSIISALLVLANPIFVIREFMEYLSIGEVSLESGVGYAAMLALVVLLQGLVQGVFWMLNFEAATRIKYGSLALLYQKVLKVKSFKDKAVGDLVNFISNDSQRMWDAIIMGPFMAGAPLVLVLSGVYGVHLMGAWGLLGWFITIFFLPFAGVCAKMSMKFREESITHTDKRVSLTNELLTCIKLIKMYAWEDCFGQKVIDVRDQEQKILHKSVFMQSVAMGSSMLVPVLATCLTFIAYVSTGNNLSPTQAFTYVSLLNTLQSSLMAVPFSLKSIGECSVTIARIKEILLLEEMPPQTQRGAVSDEALAVEVEHACCSWWLSGTQSKQDEEKTEACTEERTPMTGHQEDNNTQIYTAPVLQNITFTVRKGDMLGVCGHVGSGKSSLITALLGRMDVSSGSIAVSGSVAYVSQQAWITNDTVRNNILFGQPYDENRYKAVIQSCALKQDIDALVAGDKTEVGERGTTLSGGQKQRISLARAAYSNCNIMFLDDPLSAVDVQIGQHIFEHCIMGVMSGSTVVLVTHQLQYLRSCASVLVMKEGKVVELGSPRDLLARSDGEFAHMLKLYETQGKGDHSGQTSHREESNTHTQSNGEAVTHTQTHTDPHCETPGNGVVQGMEDLHDTPLSHLPPSTDRDTLLSQSNEHGPPKEEFEGQLTEEEEMEVGSLSGPVLSAYIQAMGGWLVFAVVLLCFSLPVATVTTSSWYLSHWLEQGGGGANMTLGNMTVASWRVVDHPDRGDYLVNYAIFIPVLIVVMLLRSASLTKGVLLASTSLHNSAFSKVLRCPMAFFDSTPLGRILNRFSADLDEIDMRLPMNAEVFLNCVLQTVAALVMIGYVSPWFLLAALPIGALFFFLMVMFHTCVTVLKRLDNVTRSPVLSHMAATFTGVPTIHAYGRTGDFLEKHCQLLTLNSLPVFLFYCTNRWLALRMEVMSAVIAFLTGILILVTFDSMNPALAGLALAYSVQMSGLFQFTARLFIETEARFTSVQRILKYCGLSSRLEEGRKSCDSDDDGDKSRKKKEWEEGWPSEGRVRFEGVSLRYRENLPQALREVRVHLQAGEKVGVVGQTGAGKTSLTAALFRLVECEKGSIYIDDVDISKVDLNLLRSKISIIPQDPVLFSGTIRYNMDPLSQYSESKIWEALGKCHIRDLVKGLPQQLDTVVQESGANFSLGERQLFCLARALLRRNKIMILDEATASIDAETDRLIQQTLRSEFSETTLLVIAHRLTSVTDSHRILVMGHGRVIECDSPSALLADPGSQFKVMLESTEKQQEMSHDLSS